MIELMFSAEGLAWSGFLGAEQAGFGPGAAYPILRERFADRLDRAFSEIVGRLSGSPAQSMEARLRVAAINGQHTAFFSKRPFALAILRTDALTSDQARLIKSIVVDQTRTLLSRLSLDEASRAGRKPQKPAATDESGQP
jgi:hypothetical protein